MKVGHLIPAAFEYFDDIYASAMALMEDLGENGVESVPFTLQYTVKSSAKIAKTNHGSTFSVVRYTNLDAGFNAFAQCDIVHLHVPLLGGARAFIHWKKQHPEIPLLITYYRPVILPDFFSLIIKIYNWFYLSRLCALSERVIVFSKKYQKVRYLTNRSGKVQLLSHFEDTARAYLELYQEVLRFHTQNNKTFI